MPTLEKEMNAIYQSHNDPQMLLVDVAHTYPLIHKILTTKSSHTLELSAFRYLSCLVQFEM